MWFVAFSLIGVAPVRMLGQVEIIFSMAFSFWFFKEQIGKTEILRLYYHFCLDFIKLIFLINFNE